MQVDVSKLQVYQYNLFLMFKHYLFLCLFNHLDLIDDTFLLCLWKSCIFAFGLRWVSRYLLKKWSVMLDLLIEKWEIPKVARLGMAVHAYSVDWCPPFLQLGLFSRPLSAKWHSQCHASFIGNHPFEVLKGILKVVPDTKLGMRQWKELSLHLDC